MRNFITFFKRSFLLTALAGFLIVSPPETAAAELTVSAAVSLKNAIGEIGRLYESRHEGLKIIFNFGASGDLMRQVEGGAPVDVFASASQKDMDEAEKKGLILSGTRVNFAENSIVLIVPSAAKQPNSFSDLSSSPVKKIAVGNPKTVPAGKYAEEVFNHYQVSAAIRDKLVFTENVRQALDYVARGEVDAGVVYKTDAQMNRKDVKVVAMAPAESHKPVVYPIAAVKGTKAEGQARGFISMVLSVEGEKILGRHGFAVKKNLKN